nr:lamin tail domain-containing protein [bacterium]
PCTFVIKTSYRGYDAASITSNPGFFIHLGYDSLKISEIGHAYSGGPSDEFIEIYNKSEYKLNLKNVYIKYSAVATNPNSDGSGGSSLRLLGNSFINKKGYYLLGSGSYTGTGTAASDSSFADGSLGATGGHVYIVYSGAILDLLGYGDAAAYAEGSSPFATANIPDAASTGSIERKANASSDAASMASGGTDEFSGNGYDSNDNAADFLARTARNPQNSISGSEPSEVGRATIYPDNSVAAGGKGTWEIRFNAGISNWSNGQLSVQIPADWTNPQKIDPAAAGYVTVSSNGTIASYSIDSTDTIVVNVTSLDPEDGYIYIKYGDSSNKTNRGGLAQVQAATGTDVEFYVRADIDGSNLEAISVHPSLDIVNVDALTIDPSEDPQTFVSTEYELFAYATAGADYVYAAPVALTITGNGSDSYLAEITAEYNYGSSNDSMSVSGYTDENGEFGAYFKVGADTGLNKVTITSGAVTEYYVDNTRAPIPIINEIAWDGDDQYEYIELYNPTNTAIDLGAQQYHLISGGGNIVTTANFSGVTIPAYGYVLIYKNPPTEGAGNQAVLNPYKFAKTDILKVVNPSFADGGELYDEGDYIQVLRDVNSENEFVDAGGVVGGPTNIINENIQGWTNKSAYLDFVQAITVGSGSGNVTVTQGAVENGAALSGIGSAGRLWLKASSAGIAEFPEVSSCGIAEFNIVAGGAGRTVKLQKKNGGSWDDLQEYTIGTTCLSCTYPVNSASAVTLRLINTGGNVIYVHDIIIPSYATSTWPGYDDYSGGVSGANNAYVSAERKWATRSGMQEASWYYSNAPHKYAGEAASGYGTPGYANSRSLYNSTIALSDESDSISNST